MALTTVYLAQHAYTPSTPRHRRRSHCWEMQQPPIELSYVEFVSECEVGAAVTAAAVGWGCCLPRLRWLGERRPRVAAAAPPAGGNKQKPLFSLPPSYSCGILQLEKCWQRSFHQQQPLLASLMLSTANFSSHRVRIARSFCLIKRLMSLCKHLWLAVLTIIWTGVRKNASRP